MVESSE
jgi:tRNA (guanine9-N1)-methyltransferase